MNEATETSHVRELFGTDGVRGVANEAPMTPEMVLRLGRAVSYVTGKNKDRPARVLIGKDTRLSGYMLETAMASGVCAMGGHVMQCGPIPTPAVAQLTVSMRADAGVVISASHNPYRDNGIKLFGHDGFKLPDAQEAEIERLMRGDELDRRGATGEKIGTAFRVEDARGRYIVYAKQTIPKNVTLDGLRIVVDAANGAGYRVAPAILSELGAEVFSIGCSPDGKNINDGVGALHPGALRREVRARRADIGIALDGDADRVMMVDEKGNIIDGDAVMALYALHQLERDALPKRTVVATVMSNLGLEKAIEAKGGKLVRTSVGDRYVVEEMRRNGYMFGGEQSGHLVFLEHASTGDGIVAALQIITIMLQTDRRLSELVAGAMVRVPQVLESIRLPERLPLEQMTNMSRAMDIIRKELGDEGRILVRWSGTEPKLRVMVEGPDEHQVSTYVHELINQARRDIP